MANVNKVHCKELLVQRMFFAIATSIIVHFMLMSGTLLITNLKVAHPLEWIQNTWNLVTCFRMWAYFIVFSVLVFFQGIVCSKDYMNATVYASSRFERFCLTFTPHNLLVGSLYILIGGAIAWLHLCVEGGRFGSLIQRCEKLQGYCLVEEHYFLLLEGFWIGLYFFASSRHLGITNLQFSIIPQSKLSQVKREIQRHFPLILLDAIWPVVYFLGFYSVFGKQCRNFFATPFSLSIEDLPLDNISRLFNLALIFYAWLHAVLFTLIIQSMHLLFQAYLTEWISFDVEKNHAVGVAKLSLTDAMSLNEIPVLQQLGFLDFFIIAQKDHTRRTSLFALSQPGGHPYNWNSVIERSLSLIKTFCENLNSVCVTKVESEPQSSHPVSNFSTVMQEKPSVHHMRNLASANSMFSDEKNDAECKPVVGENFVSKYFRNTKKSIVNYLLSKKPISYIFAEQVENKLRHVLSDAQSVIWASDAISTLAAVSLTEDSYGIVQKDLPEIIEVLLRLKQSLDKLQKMNISIRKPVSDDRYLKQMLTALRSVGRRSLYRIVSHFGDYIEDLALKPVIVDQLQPFFTYRE
ncbi:hypothetical protein QAD02_010649 [Eretmocerus hayati]|uniref:Uncharacterized protein n=1 Tax=Eretmocerus hayati TaxID=131215 RepID=A0ACC2NVF9_9HYME|nr:hypothetical protein QAD02_010649 [Eretmocerus hayati]